MSQNYTGRVVVVLVVLFGSLALIFSPVLQKLFHPHEKIDQWIALKPGIDMVGGTSLVYQIKTAPGAKYDPQLAAKVAQALKRRVDPRGVKNLIWRPEGADRLEIQSAGSGVNEAEARGAQEKLLAAEHTLGQTNISVSEATDAVENKNGRSREDFPKIAQGSAARLAILNDLAKTYDQLQAINAKPIEQRNPLDEAKLRQQYEQLKTRLDATNIDTARLRDDLSDTATRTASLNGIKQQNSDFPARLAAIDAYTSAFDAYEKVRGNLDDTTDLKRLLRGSGVLEFHILVSRGEAPDQVSRMLDRMKPDGPGPALQGGDQTRWFQIDPNSDVGKLQGNILASYHNKSYVLAWVTQDKSLDHREGQKAWSLTEALPGQGNNGEDVVEFSFDAQGASDFGTLTGNNINRPLAVILDGKVISAPNIHSMITSHGQIDGGRDGFSRAELDYLVNTLSAGSLPAQLEDEPISERHVEPELGHTNLMHGLVACAVGVGVVGVFLISYYYVAGMVAFFAVLMNLMIVLGVMAALNATFTLPSIAGIVLSVGTAVDANVLIFERLREEQHRGLSLRMALRNAYDKAMSAIVDSNATTLITSFFLIWFGTEEVKGFGITLIIGIAASLFTALFVTRTIFGILIDKGIVRNLSSLPLTFPKWDKLLRPDWMSFAWVFYAFSTVAITIGLILFGMKVRQREMLDIEFAGGTSVQFDVKQPMSKDELAGILDHSGSPDLKGANPVALGSAVEGNKYTSFDLLTPSTNAVAVRDAVMATLQNNLKLELPSTFDGAGGGGTATKLDDVLGKQVLPVSDQTKWPQTADGQTFRPETWSDYAGGVAIVLDHLSPPLTPSQITDRINRQFLQNTGTQTAERHPFTVESPKGPNQPTQVAIVLSKDPNLSYQKDKNQWAELFAGPLWKTDVPALREIFQLEPFRINLTVVAGILTIMGYSMIDTIVVFDRIRENRGKYGHVSRKVINDAVNQTLSRTLLTAGTTTITVAIMYFLGGQGIHGFTFVLLIGILVGTYSSVAIAAPILLLGNKGVEPAPEPAALASRSRVRAA